MKLIFPEACDALTRALGHTIGPARVYDGPPAKFIGVSGLALGTTREDVSSDFTSNPASLDGDTDEGVTVTCLAFSGSGGTTFKPMRDTVRDIVDAVTEVIDNDPTLGGVCDTAAVTGGTWLQDQTGEGALVTCEFRIVIRKF